jgi:hypothetical protein
MGDPLQVPLEGGARSGCHMPCVGKLARDSAELIGRRNQNVPLEIVFPAKGRTTSPGVKNCETTHGMGEGIIRLESVGDAKNGFGIIDEACAGAFAFTVGRSVEQHGPGPHVAQALAEQSHERGFGRPAVRNEDRGARGLGFRLEYVNRDIAMWRRDRESAGILQEAARAPNQERVTGLTPFGAMRFTEVAEGKIARALGATAAQFG